MQNGDTIIMRPIQFANYGYILTASLTLESYRISPELRWRAIVVFPFA
jgi:hypothetical protein